MSFPLFALMYQTQKGLTGEDFTISLGGDTANLRGIYDNRISIGQFDGTQARTQDARIGVPSADLVPYPWIVPGADVFIRTDSLRVTDLEPDGQGLTYLVCRIL